MPGGAHQRVPRHFSVVEVLADLLGELAVHLRAVVAEDEDHPHERAAGDAAGGDGIGEFFRLGRGGFLEGVADERTYEEQHPVIPLTDPGEAEAGGGESVFLRFGKEDGNEREDDAEETAADDAFHLGGFQRLEAAAHGFGDGGPDLRGGGGKFVGADDGGVRHENGEG